MFYFAQPLVRFSAIGLILAAVLNFDVGPCAAVQLSAESVLPERVVLLVSSPSFGESIGRIHNSLDQIGFHLRRTLTPPDMPGGLAIAEGNPPTLVGDGSGDIYVVPQFGLPDFERDFCLGEKFLRHAMPDFPVPESNGTEFNPVALLRMFPGEAFYAVVEGENKTIVSAFGLETGVGFDWFGELKSFLQRTAGHANVWRNVDGLDVYFVQGN